MTDGEYWAVLKKKAAKGDVDAAWKLADAYADGYVECGKGVWFYVRKNRALAERWYRFVAKTRERDAILGLANVQKDLRDALRLYLKALRMGIVVAANNIAMTYSMMGRADLCFKWLRRGYAIDPEGCAYHLALCYFVGYGTAKNIKKALHFFEMVISNKWECPDCMECAALFVKMIANGETSRPPRRGRSIGSVRPTGAPDW